MKHNLLRNFLALVLSGIMLAGVGCKNYDDDIDKINNRLDELYVTVADLDEQIESVRNAIPSLDALNEEVAALRSELDGVKTDVASIDQKLEAIGDVQAKLNELSQELKDYVNGAIQSSEETLRNELATKGAVSELEALIEGIQEDYKAELEEINNKLTALEGTVASCPPWISRATYRSSRIAWPLLRARLPMLTHWLRWSSASRPWRVSRF